MIETLKTFTALSEEFVELLMKHHPVAATEAGIHDYDQAMPDDSPAALEARGAWLGDLEQRLAASVPWDELPLEARVDFALLRSRLSVLRTDIVELRIPRRTPTVFIARAFTAIQSLLSRSFAPLDERKEAAVARLMAIPDYFEGARANLDVVPPELLEAGVELAARGPAYVDDVIRVLLRDFHGEAERLEHAGSRARTGFLQMHDHLDRELRPRAGGKFAISERWMNFRLEHEYLLTVPCAGVEAMAREAVERAREQLEDEARAIDQRRTWREIVDEARERKSEAGWLREAYLVEIERARQFVTDRKLVTLPAGERVEIIEMPLYDRPSRPVAGYQGPAPFDTGALGQFLLTPVDVRRDRAEQALQLEGHCAAALPLTTARETYPGHHVRQLFANRAPTRLRRVTRNAMLTEGWALYAEELMGEAGFCSTDPAGRLWQRLAALRAGCVALADLGLHTGRMTIPEAERMLVEDAGFEPSHAHAEVMRCCTAPTRGLAAVAGKAALIDLRDEAKRKLGERFTPESFHEAVLASGTIPPSLVREELWERLGVS